MFNLKKEKLKMKIFMILMIIFLLLTFMGAGYVFYKNGNANAGFAAIPSLFCIICSSLYRNSKKAIEENTK